MRVTRFVLRCAPAPQRVHGPHVRRALNAMPPATEMGADCPRRSKPFGRFRRSTRIGSPGLSAIWHGLQARTAGVRMSLARRERAATTCQTTGYDLPQADGSPSGTLGPQSPPLIGSEPLASENGVESAENGAAVRSRRVPNRSSFGFWYMVSPVDPAAESGNHHASQPRP